MARHKYSLIALLYEPSQGSKGAGLLRQMVYTELVRRGALLWWRTYGLGFSMIQLAVCSRRNREAGPDTAARD